MLIDGLTKETKCNSFFKKEACCYNITMIYKTAKESI